MHREPSLVWAWAHLGQAGEAAPHLEPSANQLPMPVDAGAQLLHHYATHHAGNRTHPCQRFHHFGHTCACAAVQVHVHGPCPCPCLRLVFERTMEGAPLWIVWTPLVGSCCLLAPSEPIYPLARWSARRQHQHQHRGEMETRQTTAGEQPVGYPRPTNGLMWGGCLYRSLEK